MNVSYERRRWPEKAASLIKKETLKSENQNMTKIGMDSHL